VFKLYFVLCGLFGVAWVVFIIYVIFRLLGLAEYAVHK
jgi:hypothetical protein